jgi:hypothetical protein
VGTAIVGIVVVGLGVLVAVLGYAGVARWWAHDRRQRHNDVAGFIYAVLGVIYGVLVAYVVVVVWQESNAAELTTQQEANQVADLYFLATHLPAPVGPRVQQLARAYTRSVIEDEWPLLANAETSPRTTAIARELGEALLQLDPQTARDQVLFEKALSLYQGVQDNRRLRAFQSNQSVNPILWSVLIGGAIVTVGFSYLFGLENTRTHALMVASLAGVVVSILFMIQATDYPFSGDISVPPTPYQLVLAMMNGG